MLDQREYGRLPRAAAGKTTSAWLPVSAAAVPSLLCFAFVAGAAVSAVALLTLAESGDRHGEGRGSSGSTMLVDLLDRLDLLNLR